MAVTSNTFTGDGSTTNYSFTFEYLEQDEVKVTLDGVSTTAFTFANATTLSFNTAPTNGAEIRIYRDTNIDVLKATFFPGSAIKAEDLNNNFIQNNFVVQEIQNNTWDVDLQTIKSNETWVSSDTQIATTAAMDARFQDEAIETIESTETWVADDAHIATTQAIENRIDEVITNDIGTDGTGITVTDDGDGTITLGLADNSIDFSKIKNEDIITYAEQNAGSPSPTDTNIFTASAAARRFDTLVQTSTPSGSDWEVGKTWLQNDDDKTLYMWNGTSWLPVVSGGTFTELSKVIYVDSINGDDTLTGHRISNPKKTIKAAVEDINADPDGDGSVVVVAPGIYGETFPIDIEKNDIAIVGTSLRNCIIHPAIPAEDQAGYSVDTPEPNELETMFRVNSGGYFYGLTLNGMKASGPRGGNSLDTDATYGLPTNQGWNFAFLPNAIIRKSPYIQNCTNFSDSRINNVNFTPHTPGEGSAGDLTSAPSGGGILINGATVSSSSPLRSMVTDSYTHTALDGPGIFVTNNGYAQCTSSYAFFNHYHIKCLNGGQANLAASTTDFGRYGLVVDGRSTSSIFTATTTATANDGDITFTIGSPTADPSWHGSATRPQSNMLVDIGGNTYPILSSVANGAGWDVTISRPNPSKRDENLGLDGAVASGSPVSFYLRSMIASSGHTMEYVGSGTDYTALPENGGVPIEANQVVELNDGKVWTATTDHNGKFKVGDFFTVDQRTGFVTVPVGSISFPVLAEDLDVNSHNIFDSTGDVKINDNLDLTNHKIVNVTDLEVGVGSAAAPSIYFDADTGIYSPGADQVALSTGGTGRLFIDASGNVGVGTSSPSTLLHLSSATGTATPTPTELRIASTSNASDWSTTDPWGRISFYTADGSSAGPKIEASIDAVAGFSTGGVSNLVFQTAASSTGVLTPHMTVTYYGDVGIGTTSPARKLEVLEGITTGSFDIARFLSYNGSNSKGLQITVDNTEASPVVYLDATKTGGSNPSLAFDISGSEKVRIDSIGRVGIGTSAPAASIHIVQGTGYSPSLTWGSAANQIWRTGGVELATAVAGTGTFPVWLQARDNANGARDIALNPSGGKVGIGTSSPSTNLHIAGTGNARATIESTNSANADILFTTAGTLRGVIGYNSITGGIGVDYGRGTGPLTFSYVGSEKARFDASGRLLVGTSSARTQAGITAQIQLEGTSASTSTIQLIGNSDDSLGSFITLGKTRGTAAGGTTIVSDNDRLGELRFAGADGNGTQVPGAYIGAYVDGTPGTNDMPGRLVFSTTADSAATPTERMRIDSSGRVGIGTSAPGDYSASAQNLVVSDSGNCGITIVSGASNPGSLFFADGTSASASARGYVQYNHTSNFLRFATDALERFRVDSDGRLLVGTSTAPTVGTVDNAKLAVEDSSGARIVIRRYNTDANGAQLYLAKSKGSSADNTIVANGDSLGRIGFYGADGSDLNSEAGRIDCVVDGTPGANNMPGLISLSTTPSGSASPVERMRITQAGTVNIGTGGGAVDVSNNSTDGLSIFTGGSASGSFQASNTSNPTAYLKRQGTDGTVISFRKDTTQVGTISVTASATAYNTSSDYRLKENVVPLTGAADRLNQLQVHRFNFIADPDKTVDGFLAHEAQAVVPECVTGTKDEVDDEGNPVYQGIDQSKLVPLLTAALQEALQKIETQAGVITALDARLKVLEGN